MTQTAIAKKPSGAEMLEQVLLTGDLSKLKPEERIAYYKQTCESLGLNPLTKPFDYITLNGKLTLYAKKDAADQLRATRGVSIVKLERERIEDIYTVTAYAVDTNQRQDSSIGAVNISNLKGDALANAIMKAETKAKRRVTLSICGLGMLDETEIETIPNARPTKGETIERHRELTAAIDAAIADGAITDDEEGEDEPDQTPEQKRQADISEIKAVCKELMAAGDDIPWMTKQVLADYAGQLFDLNVTSHDDLTNEQVYTLLENLKERLDSLR